MPMEINNEFLINSKDKIVLELKGYYEATIEMCGPDDEINTIPAKDLYEKAKIDILSCKDEIEEYYYMKEYCDGIMIEFNERNFALSSYNNCTLKRSM